MWNWRGEARYPVQCLVAVGEVLKREAVRAGRGYRRLYWILVGIAAGAGAVGCGGFVLWRRLTMAEEEREERQPLAMEMGEVSRKRSGGGRKKKAGAVVLGLFGSRAAAAAAGYACVGKDPAHDQFFALAAPEGLISGVVHGWFSECVDEKDCRNVCDNKCTGTGTGRKCKQKCKKKCDTTTKVVKRPREFVDRVMPKVQACGFKAVGVLKSGVDVGTRVANSGLEKRHWVRISVSGLNVTRETETDRPVRCLHAIGNQ
ncbi:hypothetical protein QBC39DRAFT_349888 [Podospora conica]|nr:hypothetical protein QBC39DRAFT_349888 [Schizothecium conicum]